MQDAFISLSIASPALPAVMVHRAALISYLQATLLPSLQSETLIKHARLALIIAPAG